jgi:hypothetical protein
MSSNPIHIFRQAEEERRKKQELYSKYHALFIASPMGQVVLADILRDLGVGVDIDPNSPAANALRNYALTVLLPKCGVITGDTQGLVEALAHYIPENKED